MRHPLRRKLITAWEQVAATEYSSQRINSESYLQAALWARLNELLRADRFRIFVEPEFRVSEKADSVKPDLVICNTRAVIAVVELKFQPRRKSSRIKDLRTLDLLARNQDSLTLSNDRYLGEGETPIVYPFASKVLYAWAGYYRANRNPVGPVQVRTTRALKDSFFSLHAVTQANKPLQTYAV